MELRLEPLGLKVELVARYADHEFGAELPRDAVVSPALSLAAARLTGRPRVFEFLPPRVTAWQQIATRYSSGKLRLAGAAAAGVVLLAGAAFGFQQWQLVSLQSEWRKMSPKVSKLESVQQQIHQYRPS